MSLQDILEPYEYLVKNPGKDFRSQLIAAFDQWLQVPLDKRGIISQVIAMLHTSSLLYPEFTRIDDVEDGSDLRRGLPVAHKIFGVAKTINAANYVYFEALQKAMELNSTEAIHVFTQELLKLHYGQGCEIHWRDSGECPTESQYLEMVSNSNFN
jgi:geranylgeranyl diphosphate synthase, type III